MNLILPYFILLIVMLQFFLRKNSKKTEQRDKEFWEKERQSNSSRKKDISSLDYITIPDDLPDISQVSDELKKLYLNLSELKEKKIVNFTGISNTDLKLNYGPANLQILTEYDDNFTILCRTIVSIGQLLMKNGMTAEAVKYLEFGIDCKSDVTANYLLLYDYYKTMGNNEGIEHLKKCAMDINSISKDIILSKLK